MLGATRVNNDQNTIANAEACLWQYLSGFYPYDQAAGHSQTFDWIIGLGSTDIRVAEACAHYWLLGRERGKATNLLFSGGYGRLSRNNQSITEAEAFRQRAIALGVTADAIYVEDQSSNTAENIHLSAKLIANLQQSSVLYVCRNIFRPRVYAVVKQQLPDLRFALASPELSYQQYANTPELQVLAKNMMAGEIERLQVYPGQGWQIALPLPEPVLQAQQRLYAAGYSNHQLKKF